MHLRKLILVGGFASALLSNMAAALGLGEVRLNSTLNEPLNAEIKLLDTRGLSASQILVGLASPADYERNGVERLYFFTEFQFDVQLNQSGGAVVRITSHNPVREPYLNFLVEARWPTGRLLREYTLLMDLPTFSESASQTPSVSTRAQTSGATGTASDTSRSRQTATQSTQSPATSGSSGVRPSGFAGDTYTVGARDTLWQIALDVRPDSGHSVHQTMLAIQRLNPDAFINGNINLLRQGQVLRVPTSADIQTLSQREAVNEVARQNRAWSETDMGAQLSAARREARSARESEAVSGSVKLATPSRDNADSGQGTGDNAGSGRALESQLAASLEELDKTRSENLELNARVRELEEQIETMERLVDISNEQLRALELGIEQSETQSSEAQSASDIGYADDTYLEDGAAVNVDDSAADIESPIEQSGDLPVSTETDPAVEVDAPAAVAEPPVTQQQVVVPPKPEKSLMDQVMENIRWIGLGALALVVLAGILIHRRRQKAIEEEFASDEELFDMSSDSAEEEFEEPLEDELGEDATDELQAFDEEPQAEAETEDVVGEADIYIAYGKLDQAEDMLLKGLEREPHSIDIRLKLLEVYSQAQNAPKFDHYYAGLLGVAGQATLARAAELRSHIQGAGDFNSSADQSSDAFAEDLSGIDLSEADDAIDLGDLDLDGASTDDPESSADDELDFSFDLEDETTALADEISLTDEDDLRTGQSSYDLSFDSESLPETKAQHDELSFDLDLDEEPAQQKVAEFDEPALDLESDSLEFSLEDESEESLDTALDLPEQAAAAPVADSDDFSFEFESNEDLSIDGESSELTDQDDLELSLDDESALGESLSEASEESLEDLQLPEDQVDDFNLDMEVGDLDLAALDQEMEDLDADLGDLGFGADDVDVGEALSAQQPPVSAESTEDLAADLDLADEEDVFDEALSGLADTDLGAEELPDLDDTADDDGDLDFLADADEAATKLDLARAYIDMGDTDGARDILAEVAHEGNDEQRQEAVDLLSRIDA